MIRHGERDSLDVFDSFWREWERDGMDGSLEERLEVLLGADTGIAVAGGS